MRFIAFFAIIASVSAIHVDLWGDINCGADGGALILSIDECSNYDSSNITYLSIKSARVIIPEVGASVGFRIVPGLGGSCIPDITVPGPTDSSYVCAKCVEFPFDLECMVFSCQDDTGNP